MNTMNMNSTWDLFRPRFPWISLALGVWLLSRGAMFFAVLLLAFAASRIWRWYRGPAAGGPRVYFHVRRGGFGGYHHRGHRGGAHERSRPFEPLERVDEAKVAAAEWRDARVES